MVRRPKVVLVHPPADLSSLYSNLSSGGSELPPLGLCYLASQLRKNNFEVSIVDCQALKLNVDSSAKEILKESPQFIGLSSYTPSIYTTAKLALKLKESAPHIPIIIGGGHITSQPLETMERFPQFDLGVIGEGEETIVEVLQTLSSNSMNSMNSTNSMMSSSNSRSSIELYEALEGIKGLVIRLSTVHGPQPTVHSPQSIVHGPQSTVHGPQSIVHSCEGKSLVKLTPKRPYIENLDSLPLPAWDLLPFLPKYYFPPADSIKHFPVGSLITSRGCPGKCIFCNLTIFGHICRSHSVDYIMEMIYDLKRRFKVKELSFVDDTFFLHKGILGKMCERLIAEKLNLSWSCYARVDLVEEELLSLMRGAGCWQIAYGLETGSQKILDWTKKGITLSQIEQGVRLTHQAGIKVRGLFMLGNFLETKETIKETIDLIKRLNLSDFHMTYFTPFPGSLSYKMAKDYGEFDPSWENLRFFTPSFIPKGLKREELEYYYKLIYKTFYLRPKIIWYYLKKLKNRKVMMKLLSSAWALLRFVFTRSVNRKS